MYACARTRATHSTQAHACMHPPCISTRTREHTCTCARTRANTCPHTWLRANRLGPYSSAVSCVEEDLISLWLFGLVCIALAWPRLRWHRWWLRLNDLGRRFAGRAVPCIKLMPFPPPCGSHWPYLSLAIWPCLYFTRMATPPSATLVFEAECPHQPVSVGMV